MKTQIMINLNQIKKVKPSNVMWEKLLEANGGASADFDKPFPLSTVLSSNDLTDTIWCFEGVPKHKEVFAKFALFCAKEASMRTKDKRVHDCISTTEKYLEGNATLKELCTARKNAHVATVDNPTRSTVDTDRDTVYSSACAAHAAVDASDAVGFSTGHVVDCNADYTAEYVAKYATGHVVYATFSSAEHGADASIAYDAYSTERQKQANHLRKLLDGEI